MINERFIVHFFVICMNSFLIWCLAFFYFESQFERQSDSCSSVASAFGTTQDKGDMRIILVYVPPFSSMHSVLTSWGTGFNKVQLI